MNTLSTFKKLGGSGAEFGEMVIVAVAMFAVACLYEAISYQFVSDFHINPYELVGTWAGLICVWLTRTQNIWCWPWGLVSSLALGVFFSQIGLPGQQWLNWGYFVIIQLWSWPHWVFGGTNYSELPVTTLSTRGRILWLAVLAAGTYAVYFVIDVLSPGSFHPVIDSLVVSSSVCAQYLLGQKKVESWVLWLGPVNLVSIVLFFLSGAFTVMILYIAFFVHAVVALRTWSLAK
ncbi:MAG: nicotinamide mononucleotide transporter [Candidatus Pacebacteria bacterium]|nr:nicotinamide mononucleotide transporter [Candidatus Paceibacterota bacterium]